METSTTTAPAAVVIPAPRAEAGGAVPAWGPGGTPLTVARPDGPVRGGVLVVQDAWGAGRQLAAVTEKFAAEGYLAVAPHLYHRAGDPVFDSQDFAEAKPLLQGLIGGQIRDDLTDGLAYLDQAGVPTDRIGTVGFCMGGSITLWAAATLPVAAAVTFYGSGITEPRWEGVPAGIESAGRIRAPWLGIYGDLDPSIPVEQVEQLRSALGSAGVAATIVRYADAGHGFATHPGSADHVPRAAAEAWTRTFGWFDAHLR